MVRKPTRPSLPLKKSSFRIPPSPFSQKEGFLKSSRPSLPLKKAPPRPSLLRSEGGNRPTRCSGPLRSKVGGPSKVYARFCGMGPPGVNTYLITISSTV